MAVFSVFLSQILTACVPLVIGGAVAGGTMIATDRRTSGAQLEDEGIELRSARRASDAIAGRGHLNITSYNRQVLVTGEVPTEQDKAAVQSAISKVENVKSVVNELEVQGNSSLATRSSDTLLTGRVKASLVDAKELSANAFKIITERGIVYLMGRVSASEAIKATEVIRSVSGVVRLVRVLEIIPEDEINRSVSPSAQPARAASAASAAK